MATKTPAKETSKGICHCCQSEIAKAKMTQHLKYCKQRMAAIATEAENASASQKTRLFHIVVEGRYNPEYWMHIEVPASDTMADLDAFLRDIWLECCGHMSAFKVGTTNYSSEPEDFSFFENEEKTGEDESTVGEEQDDTVNEGEEVLHALPPAFMEDLSADLLSEMKQLQSIDDLVRFLKKEVKEANTPTGFPFTEERRDRFMQAMSLQSLIDQLEDRGMETPLEKALKVGQKFTYEYDFGSTTDLALKVVSEREGVAQDEDDMTILARNGAPVIPCCVCGKPAKRVAALSPRQKICSRKSGECRKSKNSKKREKRRGTIHDRPQKKIQTEEEDHESVRNSIGPTFTNKSRNSFPNCTVINKKRWLTVCRASSKQAPQSCNT